MYRCEYHEDEIYKTTKTPSKAPIRVEAMRKKKGCLVIDYSKEPHHDSDWALYEFYSCLCHDNFQLSGFWDLYEVFQQFEKGIMPFQGSLNEQPSLLIEYIVLFRRLENLKKAGERQQEQAQKAQASLHNKR